MAQGNVILILGDQLSPDISSLRDAEPATDRILMAEVMAEATYVKHHPKKIIFCLYDEGTLSIFREALERISAQTHK